MFMKYNLNTNIKIIVKSNETNQSKINSIYSYTILIITHDLFRIHSIFKIIQYLLLL